MRQIQDGALASVLRAALAVALLPAALLLGAACERGEPASEGDSTVQDLPRTVPLTTGGGAGALSCEEEPDEGCPCVDTQEGLSVECGRAGTTTPSTVECFKGLRTCKAGRWGECVALGDPSVLPRPGGGLGTRALGVVEACTTNPCNAFCMNFPDTPTGVDAGSSFQITPDGGLTTVGLSCAGSPSVDDDGDGWTELQGDCNDCSAVVNPGAFDYPGNGIDDNCDGTIDNEVTTCDSGIALATSNATDFAKTMDLCKFTTAAATGASKTWGVITGSEDIVRADADRSRSPGSQQYGVMPFFGNAAANGAKKGANLAVFSSGRARYVGQTGYIKPKGWCGSSNEGTSSATPCGASWNKAGCPAGTGGYDSSGMLVQVRVPTNAQCMSFRFNYLSSEYPEWVCTPYNDAFVAMLTSSAMTAGSGCCGTAPNVRCNISYGASFTPVSVNNNLFTIPGCSNCTSTALAGTGLDTGCSGYIGGGATGWLYSYAPVKPGEIITFHTSVWDTGDNVWDSTVLMDSWDWYPGTCSIGTSPGPPTTVTPAVTTFASGTYSRDFEATCKPGYRASWRRFKWTSMEPADSKIHFKVASAPTLAALGSAAPTALVTSSGHAVPTASSADVLATMANGHDRFLRVTMEFVASTGATFAPTLYDWNQAYDCLPYE